MDAIPSPTVDRVANAKSPETSVPRAGKILLAECNRLNQKIAIRFLQSARHQVTAVTTGRQVLDSLQQNKFDLILMDVEIPEMNGIEATSTIRKLESITGSHTPIVAMTSSDLQVEACLRAGMDQHIAQPLDSEQLLHVVASILSSQGEVPVFDEAAAVARMGGDRAFFCTLAAMLIETAPALMAEMRAAFEEQDLRRMSRASHKLKGSVFPFHAAALTDAVRTMESIDDERKLAAAGNEYRAVEVELDRLLTALAELPIDAAAQASSQGSTAVGLKESTPCTA